MDFSQAFARIHDAVVQVLVLDATNNPLSFGSGVVFGSGTTVLTCNHCVSGGGVVGGVQTVVRLRNTPVNQALQATIVATDQQRDLAVLQLPQPGQPAPLRDSSTVKVGHFAFAVGFPMGLPSGAALSAHIAGADAASIRIDSSVNHGNSGGPLFNEQGQVIGIVNAKHGNLSAFLNAVQQHKSNAFGLIGGIDPIQVLKQLIGEMKNNLNLGIGYAIPMNVAAAFSPLVQANLQAP